MWYIGVWSIIKWVFSYLPIEQIIARAFSHVLTKISSEEDLTKISTTIEHCLESCLLMVRVVDDAKVTENEVKVLEDETSKLAQIIINSWAKGESAKVYEDAMKKLLTE